MVRTNTKRLWLMLRRLIALAELIGLPRAASQLSSASTASGVYGSRREAAAAVWESICVVDRIVGLMFNLPLGTAAHGFPLRESVTSPEGEIIVSYRPVARSKREDLCADLKEK